MSGIEAFRYDGKRALVIGGATGMGAAAAKTAAALGAEIVVMDVAPVDYPVAQSIHVDLRDLADIDSALSQVNGPIHAVFSAAGVAQGTPGIMKINFISQRHIIERLIESGRLVPGSSVCMISSVAGLGWESHLPTVLDFLSTPDYESAAKWVDEHEGTDNYGFSKEAMNAYVASSGFPFAKSGVRINAICPGPTDTPLAQANAEMWLGFGADFREDVGIGASTPLEQAYPLVFLCSDAAAAISGQTLISDVGYLASGVTESYPPAKPAADFLLGKIPL